MKNKRLFLNILAILLLFTVGSCGTYENPAIQTMIEAWPQMAPATIRLLITLPSFTSTIAMIIAGQYVGRYVKYRTCLIVGSILALVSGILPFFIHQNWYFILACRFFLGIGVGLLSIRNSLLVLTVSPQDLAKMIGYGSVIGSISSAVISPLVGKLTSLGWYYSFLSNAILIICVIFIILFIQEPKPNQQTKKEKNTAHKKTKLPVIIYVFLIAQVIATLVLYPLLSGISSYLSELQIGSATVAGFMLSLYTAAGIFSNLFLSKLQKIFKEHLLSLFLLLPAIGLCLVLFTGNIIFIGLGVFLSGMGFITFSSTVQVYAGLICDETNVTKATTLLLAATQLGVFLSSYFIDFTAHLNLFAVEMKNPYFICMIVYALFALISWKIRKKTYPVLLKNG